MKIPTPIQEVKSVGKNKIYMKREDLIPYSFGGNKARKAALFWEKIDEEKSDFIVTYGSSHSNHCRIIANMAVERNMKCCIISPAEVSDVTFNSRLVEIFGTEQIVVPVEDVKDTIANKLRVLREKGYKVYFIPGGGHGNIGTEAYVQCYDEIKSYEKREGIFFDYIFHASGTGTTQAGLVCGQLLNKDKRKIIGISIARQNPRGRAIVIDSIKDYFAEKKIDINEEEIQSKTIFLDNYIQGGYGKGTDEIKMLIKEMLTFQGIPMDSTYTAKAYLGMQKYIQEKNINSKNILFIHTGGTPLFFDDLKELQK